MFRKILAAIDLSPMSRPVFDQALSLAKSFRSQLALLYAFSLNEFEALSSSKLETLEEYPGILNDPLTCYIGHLEAEYLNAADPEANLLRTYSQQAIAEGVAANFFECVGAPGVAICDFAKSWQADLIVVGHRDRSTFSELLLGSVSNHVVHHAPCSVHIVYQPQLITTKHTQKMKTELKR